MSRGVLFFSFNKSSISTESVMSIFVMMACVTELDFFAFSRKCESARKQTLQLLADGGVSFSAPPT